MMYQGVGTEVNRLWWEALCLLEKESGSVPRLLWLSVARGFCFLHCLLWPPMFSFSLSKIKSFSDKVGAAAAPADIYSVSVESCWCGRQVQWADGFHDFIHDKSHSLGFPSGAVVKNLPANAGDARDVGLIPGSGRSPGGGHGNPLQYSCLERIPWTEEPGRLPSIGLQRIGHD